MIPPVSDVDVNVDLTADDIDFGPAVDPAYATPRPTMPNRPVVDEPVTAVLTRLSAVVPTNVSWLWPGRLARGKYTLIAGDPGGGKTSVSLDIASRLSRQGSTWPDGTSVPRGVTLLLSAEDGLADTIRPRVDLYGGDPEQIIVLEAVRDVGGQRPLDLARDLTILTKAIRDIRPVLVIVDPLTAYLGKTDSHRDSEVRGLLAPLIATLDEHQTALLAIAHLNKDATRAVLHRPGGSVAFVAAARLAFAVAADPQDESRRILAPLKTNICAPPAPLAFRFEDGRIAWEASPAAGMDAERLLRPAPQGDREDVSDAEQVIHELLADQSAWPIDARQALDAGLAHGISERTMRRTATRQGIRMSRVGFGKSGHWLWNHPATGDKNRGHDACG
jgi:putative DNA primase/helicase